MVCKTCLGTGRIISKCDADEGKYWNLQPCPDCIENNTCPKCDSEIFYDEDMMSYKHCQYKLGIPVCERYHSLPTTFSIDSHLTYYGEKFDECAAQEDEEELDQYIY